MKRWFSKRPKPPASRPGPSRPPRGERPSDWRTYDSVAELYERTRAPYTEAPVADLLRLADIRPGQRILDVGTGTGRALALVKDAVGPEGTVAGVDLSVPMLRAGARARPESALAAADVLDLPFRNESFDAAFTIYSLPHFTKLDTALAELGRILRPGGTLGVVTFTGPEDEFMRVWRRLAEEAVGLQILRASLAEESPWADRLSDAKRLETVLRDNGFRPVRVEPHTYRFRVAREDYLLSLETKASGRFVRSMLGPSLWEPFRQRVRAAFAEYPDPLVDLRDALVAVAGRPAGWQGGISGT